MVKPSSAPVPSPSPRDDGRARFLALLALSTLSIAQPLFDILGKNAAFFVVRRTPGLDLGLFMVFLVLGVPAVLWVLEQGVARFHRRGGWALHRIWIGLLVALLAAQALRRLEALPAVVVALGAMVIGAVAAWAYTVQPKLRQFVRFLSVAALLVPMLFLAGKGIRDFVWAKPLGTAPGIDIEASHPVVVVVFDGLSTTALLDPNFEIDRDRYPRFAALGDDSIWFRYATTVSDGTIFAVPALLASACHDNREATPDLANYPNNLFTLFGTSFELVVREPVTALCPESLCAPDRDGLTGRLRALLMDVSVVYAHLVTPQEWADGWPPISNAWSGFTAREGATGGHGNAKDSWSNFLSGIRRGGDRTLYFVHSVVPHAPYRYAPSGKRYRVRDREPSGQGDQWGAWSDDETAVVHSFQRYLLQLGYVDFALGQLIDRLEDQGLYDEALVVVTADHGVSFRPSDDRRGLTSSNVGEILPVPLFVKVPGQSEGVVRDDLVTTLDVLPTVADALDVELNFPTAGRSLLDPPEEWRELARCFGYEQFWNREMLQKAMTDSVDQRFRWFPGADPLGYAVVPEVHGRGVEELPLSERPPVEYSLLTRRALRRVRPDGDFIPAEVTGRIDLSPWNDQSVPLALALNGTVLATTRPYASEGGGSNGVFSAVLPEAAFVEGRNQLDLFVVEEREPNLRMTPATYSREALSFLGVELGPRQVVGVRTRGLHLPEQMDGRTVRWTGGEARFRVPLRAGETPERLLLELVDFGTEPTRLQIAVNGVTLVDEILDAPPWKRDLSIAEVPAESELTIDLRSDTGERPNLLREIELGVAISSLLIE